jgi:hypothetical protein
MDKSLYNNDVGGGDIVNHSRAGGIALCYFSALAAAGRLYYVVPAWMDCCSSLPTPWAMTFIE